MKDAEEVATIPLVEERLEVGKRQVESGRVKVRIEVDSKAQAVPAELSHDEVEIRRVPLNLPLSELPAVRLEGDTTVIPVVEEQLVVEKRLVLVEEIHVVKRSRTAVEDIEVVLRSERAEIEREPGRGGEEAEA